MKERVPKSDPYEVELDEYEQELEDNFEFCTRLSPLEEGLEIEKLVAAAKNHVKANKLA